MFIVYWAFGTTQGHALDIPTAGVMQGIKHGKHLVSFFSLLPLACPVFFWHMRFLPISWVDIPLEAVQLRGLVSGIVCVCAPGASLRCACWMVAGSCMYECFEDGFRFGSGNCIRGFWTQLLGKGPGFGWHRHALAYRGAPTGG